MIEILSGETDRIQHLILPAKLALPEAEEFGKILIDLSQKKQTVIVDFKNVQDIRTPFIQMILSALKFFIKNDLELNFINIGQCVKESFSVLGLGSYLVKMESIEI